jgi:hypothetical protein
VETEDREKFIKSCLHRFVKNSKPLITINSPYNTTGNHEKNKLNENSDNYDLHGNDEKHESKDINNKDDSHSHQKDLRYDMSNHIGDYIEVGKGAKLTNMIFTNMYISVYLQTYTYIYMHTYYIHIYIYMYIYIYVYVYGWVREP